MDKKKLDIIKKLNTPAKIQDFINKLPVNFEEDGKDTCMSPLSVLEKNKCHCIEGAFFAAMALRYLGFKPLVVDMRGTKDDCDHVIAVFQVDGKWGAISKTNHAVLRYREPVYKDIRELVMSYFHEYSDSKGNKTLREYSNPVDLSIFDNTGNEISENKKEGFFYTDWMISEEDLWHVHDYLDSVKHFSILTKKQEKNLRKQDKIEIELDKFVEFKVLKKVR